MKWSHLGLFAALLVVLIGLSAQTQPILVGFSGGVVGSPIQFPDGTLAAPSITFSADNDTGFFRPGANQVEVGVGGNTAVALFGASAVTIGQNHTFSWGSSGLGAADVGLARLGAASLTVNNGSTSPAALQLTSSSRVLALPAGALGFATASTATTGNTGQGARLVVVCGPTSGTASLLFYAGTTNVPVVLANAVGGGLIGC